MLKTEDLKTAYLKPEYSKNICYVLRAPIWELMRKNMAWNKRTSRMVRYRYIWTHLTDVFNCVINDDDYLCHMYGSTMAVIQSDAMKYLDSLFGVFFHTLP